MSGAASRRKGAGYERDVVRWLNANGYGMAERRIPGMANDRGDISGVPYTVIECKNQRRIELGTWFTQMQQEQAEAAQALGALFIKRRGVTDVGQHYVVVSGDTWLRMLAGYLQCPQ